MTCNLENRPRASDVRLNWQIIEEWFEGFEKEFRELWDYVKQVDKGMVSISSVSKSIHPDEWESIKGLIHKLLEET